jgi:AraC-like DNA-binding protein
LPDLHLWIVVAEELASVLASAAPRPSPASVNVVKSGAGMNQPAAEIIITRLSEILFLQAVRSCINARSSADAGWFGALKDLEIDRALVLLQREPHEPWTVEMLAKHLNVSRSAFSARFKQLVGEPPMHYLTRLRLTKAAAVLRTQPATLFEVARSIGYDSEVAFSKAFKRYYGIEPGAYRQRRQALIDDVKLTNGYRTSQATELLRASSPAFEASLPRQRRET